MGIFSIRQNIPKYTAFSWGCSLAWPSFPPHTQACEAREVGYGWCTEATFCILASSTGLQWAWVGLRGTTWALPGALVCSSASSQPLAYNKASCSARQRQWGEWKRIYSSPGWLSLLIKISPVHKFASITLQCFNRAQSVIAVLFLTDCSDSVLERVECIDVPTHLCRCWLSQLSRILQKSVMVESVAVLSTLVGPSSDPAESVNMLSQQCCPVQHWLDQY